MVSGAVSDESCGAEASRDDPVAAPCASAGLLAPLDGCGELPVVVPDASGLFGFDMASGPSAGGGCDCEVLPETAGDRGADVP